jgi:hypothetical protein
MTNDDQPDDTPRTYNSGGEHHGDPYRGADPAMQDLYRRMHRLEERDGERELAMVAEASSNRTWRWIAGICLPIVFAGLISLLAYSVSRIEASAMRAGRQEATSDELRGRVLLLEGYIHELLRRAGLDQNRTVAVDGP